MAFKIKCPLFNFLTGKSFYLSLLLDSVNLDSYRLVPQQVFRLLPSPTTGVSAPTIPNYIRIGVNH